MTQEVQTAMDNRERRQKLNEARTEAYRWASQAREAYTQNAAYFDQVSTMSLVWSNVAEALKREEGEHDSYVNTGPK